MKNKNKIGKRMICLLCAGILSVGSQTAYPFAKTVAAETTVSAMAVDRAQSTVKSMSPGGFVGLKVLENIEKWQLDAYKENPNIVEAIAAGNRGKIRLNDLQAGSVKGYFDITVDKSGEGQSLKYTNTASGGGMNDIDFKFALDNTAVTDWSGAKELWVYADYSSYNVDKPMLRVSFEEKDSGTGARKSWRAKANVSYVADGSNHRVSATLWDYRVVLPKNFKGWVCWQLDEASLERYFANGALSAELELKHVQQFQIAAWGDNFSVGTSYTLDKFAIAGDVDGVEMPVQIDGDDGFTFKEVWSIDGLSPDSYDGSMMAWYGEFAGKHLTGLALNYAVYNTKTVYNAGKSLADDLVAAQGEDGYLGRFFGDARYAKNDNNWDVWCNHHNIYGLYRWYKVTGESKYLDAAVKGLDCAMNEIGKNGKYYGSFGQEMNMAISHAFIVLYSETGKVDYLSVAEHIVNDNWKDYGDWLDNAEKGKDFYSSKLPRWEALHTITTLGGLYEATGKERYLKAFEQIWESIRATDVHNNGSFSSGEGACGDPYSTGAVETCCTVAWMALSAEFLQISKRSDVADELELSYMNGMLGTVTSDGKHVTYDTPMNGRKIPALETLAFQYNGGSPDFSCCQANFARGIGEISDWAVLTDSDTVYLNYYGESEIEARTPNGKKITFRQITEYPANGNIKIKIDCDDKTEFSLALRIPKWSSSSSVVINGETQSGVFAGKYFTATRNWANGDLIEINLDMGLHYYLGHGSYEGYCSVYSGPMLLTLDGGYASGAESVKFNINDLENAVKVDESGRLISLRTFTADGIPVMLCDFAGAGRSGSFYASWLAVNLTDDQRSLLDNESSVWHNVLPHDVYFDDSKAAVSESSGVFAGTEITLFARNNEIPTAYAGGKLLPMKKISDNVYVFVMPQRDVYIVNNV